VHTTLPVLGQCQGCSTPCESHGSDVEKTTISSGENDWIWTGSNGKSGHDTGIEDCCGREKLELKVWLGKNKDGSQSGAYGDQWDKNSVWTDQMWSDVQQ